MKKKTTFASASTKIPATMPNQVIGVGGGGNNAVNRMIDSGMEGIEFVVPTPTCRRCDAAAPDEDPSSGEAHHGLGAGANPEVDASHTRGCPTRSLKRSKAPTWCFVTAGLARHRNRSRAHHCIAG